MPRSPERQPQEARGEASTPGNELEAQIQAIINLSQGFQDNPGEMLAPIWESDAFRALSPEEQDALKAKYRAGEAEEAEKERRVEKEAPPAVEAAETTGTEKKLKTWLFIDYVIQQDPKTGAFLIYENQSKYDDRREKYIKNRRPNRTAIKIPDELVDRLQQEPELGSQVIEFCSDLRKKLDRKPSEGGLAMYYDVRKGKGPKSWQPKWKFTWEDEAEPAGKKSRVREDMIGFGEESWDPRSTSVEKPDVIPPEIYAIVEEYLSQGSQDYHRDPRYRPWRGKAQQRKREDLISEGLAHRQFAVAETPSERPAQVTEPDEKTTAEMPPTEEVIVEPRAAAEPAASVEVERPETKESRMQECLADSEAVIRTLVPAVAAFYPGQDRESRVALVKHVVKSAVGILNDRYGRTKDTAALDEIGRDPFFEALAEKVAKEADRQETARKFFEQHAFYDAKNVEVLSENSLIMSLDRLNADSPEAALELAARAMVLDALYGKPEAMRAGTGGTSIGPAEARVVQIVAETLRRLKDKRADSIDFDGAKNRLAVTDLETIRRVIRSKFEILK